MTRSPQLTGALTTKTTETSSTCTSSPPSSRNVADVDAQDDEETFHRDCVTLRTMHWGENATARSKAQLQLYIIAIIATSTTLLTKLMTFSVEV